MARGDTVQDGRHHGRGVQWVLLATLLLLGTACGPPTIEEPTETPEVTPEGTPTFAPGIDVDGDGYGVNEECDDTYDETYPGAEEVCDGRDNDCNGKVDDRDIDGDGYRAEACGGTDCDDDDAGINPGAEEVCDDIDQNCNGEVDEGAKETFYLDRDEDGYGDPNTTTSACTQPSGYVANGDDCRDQDANINPGQTEVCNGLDDDCDNIIDNDLEVTTYYQDADNDGYGDAHSPPFETCDTMTEGYVSNNEDCDDSNADVYPGAIEVCNQIDDDCDGFVDQDDPDGVTGYLTFYLDRDGDGYGDDTVTEQGCDAPEGYTGEPGDCDDSRDDIYPGAEETCNGLDDDCDTDRDEGFDRTLYRVDDDEDGFGATEVLACAVLDDPSTAHLSTARGDCNDASALVYPGAVDAYGDDMDSDCGGHDAADPHVGLSAGSLSTIQTALDAATDGATVWVGPGTYREVQVDFQGKAVALRATNGQDATIIDAEQRGYVFLFQSVEGPETVVDGFTLTGGAGVEGGAIYMVFANPTVTACTVAGNTADYGAGMFLFSSSPALSNVVIRDNTANVEGGGLYFKSSNASLDAVTLTGNTSAGAGGGCSLRASSPTIVSSVISGNQADLGGGCYVASDSAPNLEHLLVSENTATRGAGFYLDSAAPVLSNCTVEANIASEDGGGFYLKSAEATFTNVLVSDNVAGNFGGGLSLSTADPTADNLVVTGNTAPYGAGLYLSASSPTLRQALVMRNDSSEQGGGLYLIETGSEPTIVDSIVAYNTGDNLFNHPLYAANPSLTYTILYTPTGTDNHNLEALDATVLEVEPEFLSYDDEGLPDTWHLTQTSPAVNSGVPGTSDPDGSPADMGAFGGPYGDQWDLDNDGVPLYFWPGVLANAPEGFDAGDYEDANGG